MALERTVLLVTPTPRLLDALVPRLWRAGYRVCVARTFQSAKAQLSDSPDLLITELKLGAYNGLQLALRSIPSGIPAIVVADRSFEHEVEQLGAVWMSPESAATDDVRPVVSRLLQGVPTSPAYPWYPADIPDASSSAEILLRAPHTSTLH